MKLNLSIFLPIILLLYACGNGQKPVKPSIKNISHAVYASGKIYPLGYYKVNATIPGQIAQILVEVGDTVKAGQPLLVIRNEVSGSMLEIAANNLALAKDNASKNSSVIAAAVSDLESAMAKYKNDSINYTRVKGLVAENAGTKQALDNAYTLFEVSKESVVKAKANLANTKIRVNTELKNAGNQYQAQLEQKKEYTVYAAITGKVFDILMKPGDYASPQMPVMELGDAKNFEVELAIDEADIRYTFAGQAVVFTSEGYEDQVFNGAIKRIYPKISVVNKSIKAIADISLPANTPMYAGATLEANILVEERKNAIVVPKYLVFNDSVLVRDGVGYKKIKVVTGISDVENVEIVSGIDAQTELYKQ